MVEAHSCLLNMNMTFGLTEIKEMMPQKARRQLETELETSCCRLGGFAVCIQQFWSVQSSPESRFYRPVCNTKGYTQYQSL